MGGLLLAALILRNSVFVELRAGGAVPELVLLVVVAVALLEGPERAAVVGFVGGMVQDLSATVTPVGLSAMAFVLVAFGAGLAHTFVIRPGRLLPVGLAMASTAAAGVAVILAGAVVGQEYLVTNYQFRIVFWASCYSALLFPGVLALVRRVLAASLIDRAPAIRT